MSLRKTYIAAAIIAGILEFAVTGLLFLMAGFTFTGYLTIKGLAVADYGRYPEARAQLILGFFAIFGFLIGLAGSVSAMERRRWVLSLIAPLTTGFWGILLSFYTMLVLSTPDVADEANAGMTIGYVVILFSLISGLLILISRSEFLRRAKSSSSVDT